MNKRGLSAVITTLILILLVLVAIGIVWVVIQNVVVKGAEEIELEKMMVDMDIKKVVFNENNISITLKRNVGGGDVLSLKFVVKNSTNSEILEKESQINELEQKIFTLSPNMNVSSITQISIAPIFKTSSGKEVVGSVSGTYKIKGTEVVGESSCTPLIYYRDADSDSYGNATNTTSACPPAPLGYVSNNIDCNDNDVSKWQLLNGYTDSDNDGYGSGSSLNICSGSSLPLGYSNNSGDCNDTNININPGAIEICGNGIDEDCNGSDLICSCVPASCPANSCGNWNNGTCSGTLNCGTCSSGYFCNSSIDGSCIINDTAYLKTWPGLVSWWRLNGNADDEMGINNGVNNGATLTTGKYSGAYQFDGVNDYINLNDILDLTSNSFTIAAWIYPKSFGEGGYGRIVDKFNLGNTGYYFYIRGGTTNDLAFGVSSIVSSNDFAITTNTWQHVAVSVNGITATFYINGVNVGNPGFTFLPTNNNLNLLIGNRLNGDRTFNGTIDEVMIFNRSLTTSEVLELYGLNLSM